MTMSIEETAAASLPFERVPEVGQVPSAFPDDALLLSGLRQHHPDALEELVRRYRLRILRRAARHVRSHADAEDLAQEVLLKVYLHVQRFEGDTLLWPWIARITSNTAISLLRMRRLRESTECPSGGGIERVDGYGPPVEPWDVSQLADELASRAELRDRLRTALRDLPVAYREAIVLKDLRGYTSAEASRCLHVPVPTVKSRVNRGRRLLKRALAAFEAGVRLHRRSAA
jgi:RNA polymerase sigma-70 factor (ECF subfamily)